jgi:hypothetical protein
MIDQWRAAVPSITTNFGSSPPFTVGVEEELFLVDPCTHEVAHAADAVLAHGPRFVRGQILGELCDGVVELATPVCRTATEAAARLRALRATLGEHPAAARLMGAGVHPHATRRRRPPVRGPLRGGLGEHPLTAATVGVLRPAHPHRDARPRDDDPRSTAFASGSRCCRRSAPTRRSGTAATPAWPAVAPCCATASRARGCRERSATGTTTSARLPSSCASASSTAPARSGGTSGRTRITARSRSGWPTRSPRWPTSKGSSQLGRDVRRRPDARAGAEPCAPAGAMALGGAA